MSHTTIKKVDSNHSPQGDMGQTYLATGVSLSMRLWRKSPDQKEKRITAREYETVGYLIEGKAELEVEGQTVLLEAGDSWVVPAGAKHRYRVLEPLLAVEATSPPAHVNGRDLTVESPTAGIH